MKAKSIAICAVMSALWVALNVSVAPIIFSLTNMPFACDFIHAIMVFTTSYASMEFGIATLSAIIVLIVTLFQRGFASGIYFLGFVLGTLLIDFLLSLVLKFKGLGGFKRAFIVVEGLSIVFTAFSGFIIGLIMAFLQPALGVRNPLVIQMGGWIFTSYWTGMHTIGGIISGPAVFLVLKAIEKAGVRPHGG
ncbi:MAG: hypothetical protein NDF51_07090 [archaeon YNP-WB-040]|nr:hypothetical protein [Candidatus Verstraetearchaeota archaeon]MCR6669747.1 hypothetical protein [Candidatus Culexarchaeum yellowstonense]